MHVKLVVNSFPTTSETFLFNLVVGLEKRGVKVTVCASAPSKDIDLYRERLKEWSGNIEIVPLNFTRADHILKALYCIINSVGKWRKATRRSGFKKGTANFLKAFYLENGKPDILHFSFSGVAVNHLDALSLKNHKSKLFVSCRGSAEKVKPITDVKRKQELIRLFKIVARVHCVSKDMMQGLIPLGLNTTKVFINYPSIDTDRFKLPEGSRKVNDRWYIVSTGRLHFQKGYIFALQAMQLLKERGVDFEYHILGEGPDRNMIMYAIHELGLNDTVFLHGRVKSSEVFEHLCKADLFLLSSLYEGVANAALEAMSMSIPVVATTSGGMAEVIEDSVNGMLVPRFDGAALANKIGLMLASPELRSAIGRNGRTTVEKHFRSEMQIDIFLKEYKKITE